MIGRTDSLVCFSALGPVNTVPAFGRAASSTSLLEAQRVFGKVP